MQTLESSMKSSGLFERMLAEYDRRSRLDGSVEERALKYVRERFGDSGISMDQIRPKSAMDYLHAQRSDECRRNCPGRDRCPYRGRIYEVAKTVALGESIYSVFPHRCLEYTGQLQVENLSKLLAESRIPASHKDCSFENYEVDGLKADVRIARGATRECAEDETWVFLHGQKTGTGKTHLAVALLKARIAQGKSGLFMNARDLYGELHEAIATRQVEAKMNLFRRVDCLVIDDAGVQHDSNWFGGQLYGIINDRYEHRQQTVITSNASSMDTFSPMCGPCGDRIVSRLQELAIRIRIDADDYRIEKGQQRLFKKTKSGKEAA